MMRMLLLFICFTQMQFCFGNKASRAFEIVIENGQEGYLKHYVSADQISICEEGILIHLEKVGLQLKSIFHDEYGFYYLEEGVSWICNWCGELNPLDRSICSCCGNPYGSGPDEN
jgi:hypothetical protein